MEISCGLVLFVGMCGSCRLIRVMLECGGGSQDRARPDRYIFRVGNA